MEFDKNKIYKIVYRDDGVIKSPKGNIVNSDDNYIAIIFPTDNTELFINHKAIVTIIEVVMK